MYSEDEAFLQELQDLFQLEAGEYLNAIADGLLDLEQEPTDADQAGIIETIFRSAHSLKGSSRMVNRMEIGAMCQSLEDIFELWHRQQLEPALEHFDLLHRAIKVVEALVRDANSVESSQVTAVTRDLQRLANDYGEQSRTNHRQVKDPNGANNRVSTPPQERQTTASRGAGPLPQVQAPVAKPQSSPGSRPQPGSAPAADKVSMPQTVRVSTAKLDMLLLQAEELLTVKLTTLQRASDLQDLVNASDQWKKQWDRMLPQVQALRHDAERAASGEGQPRSEGQSDRLLAFLDWNGDYVRSLHNKLQALARTAAEDHRALGSMVDNILDDTKKALMRPFSSLLDILPRLVRDIAREQGKEVHLEIRGGEIEIDRRILEEMKDALIHLVRNSIDHGVESPNKRLLHKKDPRATLQVTVSQVDSSKVQLLISDDGAGIDLERVKGSAVKRGVVSEEDVSKMDDHQATMLIFASGVSTSRILTDISGRGLGMAIVREKVEKLGGRISVETAPRKGTQFRILLPLTLATFRGVLVEAAEQLFLVPTANVVRVTRTRADAIKSIESHSTISFEERAIPLVSLGGALGLPDTQDKDTVPIMILGSAETQVAFGVDRVLHEQEVLVKGLGPQLSRVPNISGATILGSGQIVPILNVPDLLLSARRAPGAHRAAVQEGQATGGTQSILVAEDSITTRTLIKNILQSSGYRVSTAVDGMDAFRSLKESSFDLLVSDIEMPRMDGFDLTARIRADEDLANLPVVLVTSLASREDREKGIEAGADAYVVKSAFDQRNLVQIIQRLI